MTIAPVEYEQQDRLVRAQERERHRQSLNFTEPEYLARLYSWNPVSVWIPESSATGVLHKLFYSVPIMLSKLAMKPFHIEGDGPATAIIYANGVEVSRLPLIEGQVAQISEGAVELPAFTQVDLAIGSEHVVKGLVLSYVVGLSNSFDPS